MCAFVVEKTIRVFQRRYVPPYNLCSTTVLRSFTQHVLVQQVLMFITISGFQDNTDEEGFEFPGHMDKPNDGRLIFSLIRWMSPHPDAIVRDDHYRPVPPPPLSINHALWKFTSLPEQRESFIGRFFNAQRNLFASKPQSEILQLSRAMYDLITPDTFSTYMNCTLINETTDTMLETITLPFN